MHIFSRPRVAFLLALAATLHLGLAQEAAPQENKFKKEVESLVKRLEVSQPPSGGIAFVGSSTMRLWKLEDTFPGWKMANTGFGGATIPDQLEFFDTLVAPLKPKQVIFFCGGNDLSQKRTPDAVVADFKAWVGKMKAVVPDCDITYIGIRPSPSRVHLYELEQKVNGDIKTWGETNGVKFLNLEDTVLNADGSPKKELFLPDMLHLNPEGYKIWAKRVLPLLNDKLPH
jgi:lysophospholipase L1-like esterase